MDGTQRRASDDAAGTTAVTYLGVGLVFASAVALVIAMFLQFAQPFGFLPIIGNDNLYGKLGWYGFLIPFLLVIAGYPASQGKQGSRWSLVVICAVAAVGIVLLATAKSLRTLYPIGADGTPDVSQPGLVTGLGIAIYVAGAAVAIAFIGTLALFQDGVRAERLAAAREVQRLTDAQAQAKPAASPEPEHAALEVGASGAEVESHAVDAPTRTLGSRLQWTWPLAAAIVVVVATAAGYLLLGRPPTPSNTAQHPTKLTSEQVALEKFLLSADQINTAMGTSGLTVGGTVGELVDVASKISDDACIPVAAPGSAQAYEGSGWSTVVGREVREPGNFFRHGIDQFVVSFPSGQEAAAFFTASTQSWQACADRDYTMTMMGQNLVHTAGPLANVDGTLTISHSQKHLNGSFVCQRALTVAKNVVVDVSACALNMSDVPTDTASDAPSGAPAAAPSEPPPGAAANIAHQIAANVT